MEEGSPAGGRRDEEMVMEEKEEEVIWNLKHPRRFLTRWVNTEEFVVHLPEEVCALILH